MRVMSIFWCVRLACSKAFLPLLTWARRRWYQSENYNCWHAGGCTFYGPPSFLALCSRAMDQLASLDKSLYQSLLEQELTFWYEPIRIAVVERGLGISEGFLKWKEQGIIACIIFEYFESEMAWALPFWRRCSMDRCEVWEEIHEAVQKWLEGHSFPRALIDCFSVRLMGPGERWRRALATLKEGLKEQSPEK